MGCASQIIFGHVEQLQLCRECVNRRKHSHLCQSDWLGHSDWERGRQSQRWRTVSSQPCSRFSERQSSSRAGRGNVGFFTSYRVSVIDYCIHSASVDLETDSKIQRTIQTQFHDRTLLCIARMLSWPWLYRSRKLTSCQIAWEQSYLMTVSWFSTKDRSRYVPLAILHLFNDRITHSNIFNRNLTRLSTCG